MPNPKLPDTFKGKSFGEISKNIESKYKDRFDPISRRGLMAEMGALRDEQEFQRDKQQAREQLQQMLTQQQPQGNPAMQDPMMQQQMGQQMMTPEISASNQGVAPELPQEDMGNFAHAASQSYNQKFGKGGQMQYFNGGPFDRNRFTTGVMAPQVGLSQFTNVLGGGNLMNPTPVQQSIQPTLQPVTQQNTVRPQVASTPQGANFNILPNDAGVGNISRVQEGIQVNRPNIPVTSFQAQLPSIRQGLEQSILNNNSQSIGTQGMNPLRFAPLAANLFGILSARRAPSTQSQLRGMGFRDRVDESLANVSTPRQTQFGNVDMSQIERGIQQQARGFSGANLNVSGGQSGQFLANELANQSNVMNAIAQARMQQQQMDRQTQQLNAQEQARIDAFGQQQAMQRAGLQAQNVGMGMQMADLDARNEGAFNATRLSGLQALGQSVGNIGRESDQMTMLANALGYNSFGDYVANLPENEKRRIFGNIFGSRRK